MIQNLVEKYLGHPEYTSGNEHAYYCPNCNWKNPRLMVNYNDDKFHCWYCNWGGQSNIGILYKLGVNNSIIQQAKRELGIYAGFSSSDHTISSVDKVKNILHNNDDTVHGMKKLFRIPKSFSNLYDNRKLFKQAYRYLRLERGLSQKEIKLYNFHYDPDQRAILLPSYYYNGNINYYIVKKLDGGYINLEESKFNSIFFESYIDFSGDINLTEGGFDAISIGYNTIPLLGLKLSPLLIETIKKHRPRSVTLYLDRTALYNSYHLGKELYNMGINTYMAHNSVYDDPNDTPRDIIKTTLQNRKQFNLQNLILWQNNNLYEMFSS